MNVSYFANFGARQAADWHLIQRSFLERIQIIAVMRGSMPHFVP